MSGLRALAAASTTAVFVIACGGGTEQGAAGEEIPLVDGLPIVVDEGPVTALLSGRKTLNIPFTSVVICATGEGAQCETVDHVQVDTGSVGLRLLASAFSRAAAMTPVQLPASELPLRQCAQFADGYSWGTMVIADVWLGGRVVHNLTVNLMADPRAGTAPPSCVSGPSKDTVSALGGNGVLGIGAFVRDCGELCARMAVNGTYYQCPAEGSGAPCQPTAVPLEMQLLNPVAALSRDNNGVSISLPALTSAGAQVARGSLAFGIDTRQNNSSGAARFFSLDERGTLLTSYGGRTQTAVVDSGSNGYFFSDAAIARCDRHTAFYCPTSGGSPTSLAQTAVITGHNGASQQVGFHVDNLDTIYNGQAALPGVAAPTSNLIGGAQFVFDWGLPFFYGRTVRVLFEGERAGANVGPAVAF